MSVAAKVVKDPGQMVPSLTGSPFNRDLSLQVGVHVHWALPDALTHGRAVPENSPTAQAIFPGVPDLWLVTRFNPVTTARGQQPVRRTWRAWVLDALNPTAPPTPLEQWTPPSPARGNGMIHTFIGKLPPASGYPGWGLCDARQTQPSLMAAAYYPSARGRFGFYDDHNDLGANASGNVSYTVIGWYSLGDDPLANSSDRAKLLDDWNLTSGDESRITLSAAVAAAVAGVVWSPNLKVDERPAPPAGTIASAPSTQPRFTRRKAIQDSLGIAVDPQAAATVFADLFPSQIVCHGSVVAVPLGTAGKIDESLPGTGQVALYPSSRRALAAVAAPQLDPTVSDRDRRLDYTEMLLQDLQHQRNTAAGVLDLPGAAHALTFQGVPGKSKFYAQIDIYPDLPMIAQPTGFTLSTTDIGRAIGGFWPPRPAPQGVLRKASSNTIGRTTIGPTGPAEPSTDDITSWSRNVRNVLAAAVTAATAGPTHPDVDPRLVRVVDHRGRGSTAWLDSGSDDALKQLRLSTHDARVDLPDANALYEVPGPRWYRPWAPQIVLQGAGRSYRFGEDGCYDPENGTLKCRRGGHAVAAIHSSASDAQVFGSALLANAAIITAKTGLPSDTLALLAESLLYDADSAPAMAALSALAVPAAQRAQVQQADGQYFPLAIQGLWASRLASFHATPSLTPPAKAIPFLQDTQREALAKIQVAGDPPSPVAITPWKDPFDALFVDANYSHPHSSLATYWELDEDEVEMSPTDAAGAKASNAGAPVEIFVERCPVTATIARVLEKTLVTRTSRNLRGWTVPVQDPPKGLDSQVFLQQDVLSASLVGFDSKRPDDTRADDHLPPQPGDPIPPQELALFARGYRERTGALRLNKLDLIGVFGTRRSWDSGIAPTKADSPSDKPWWTPLTPRLPAWSRLMFRLQDAKGNGEATSYSSPIRGILLPDFLDHSLQVFDGSGRGIGTLICDRAQFGGGPNTAATTLNVKFEAYPWVLQRLSSTSHPLDAIENDTLRQVVHGITLQSVNIPANASKAQWYETGLTAMLRVIDTVRGTLDPSLKTPDRKLALLGEPILVMAARVSVEMAAPMTKADVLAGGPDLLPQAPALPPIQVRIGDITRPDDGVFGIFFGKPFDPKRPDDDPKSFYFAPVSESAAKQAVFNGWAADVPPMPNGLAVQHRFVVARKNVITVTPNDHGTPQDLVLLTDIRGALYATSGVLPRKKITVPKDFIEASLRNMEPVVPVGPVLSFTASGAVRPLFPPPQVAGYDADFLYPDQHANKTGFAAAKLPTSIPVGDLPPGRVTLNEGWVRLEQRDK
jgi:hypothetical protein